MFHSRNVFSLIFLKCIPWFSIQVTHWGTKREILCDESGVIRRHRAHYTFWCCPSKSIPSKQQSKINTYESDRVSRSLFVVFMVASTWGVPFRSEMELGTLLSPLFGESVLGENSCLLDCSLWGVPIPIPHHSFRDQMYKSNPAAESHVWGLLVSAWAIVVSKLSSFTFSS